MADATVHPLDQRARREPEPVLRSVFGSVLRRVRLRQGRTLADVAGRAGVSTPYLSEVERGLKEASSEVLAALSGALQLEVVDLVALVHAELRATDPRTLDRPLRVPVSPRAALPARSSSSGFSSDMG